MARMYYTGEAAKELGISQRHIMRLLKDGTITEPKMRNSSDPAALASPSFPLGWETSSSLSE